MVNCVISFNNETPNGVFCSGQEVSGTVTLHNEKPRMIRALLLKVEGYAHTWWTETSGTGDNKKSRSYSAREDYIKTVSFLVNNGPIEQTFPEGQHTFNFCFMLPLTIPSSFYNYSGKIVYHVKVEMERRLKFNYSFEFPFTVVSHLDLNCEGVEIRKPLKGEISKKFFLGLGSNALTVTAEIPFCGFVAGQTLSIAVKMVNESSVKVDQVFVELYQQCLFKCDFISTKNDSNLLVKGELDGVAAKTTSQATFSIEIPPVIPTIVRFSKYIVITYEVLIIAKVSGLHRSLYLRMPITIGTVPLCGLENNASSSCPHTYDFAVNANNENVRFEEQTKD